MKILIIVKSLTSGGAERVAASWANGLLRRGHEVFILTDSKGQTYLLDKGITIVQRKFLAGESMPFLKKLVRKSGEFFADFFQIRSLLCRLSPDAVIDVLNVSAIPFLFARPISFRKHLAIMTDHNTYERPKGNEFTFREWRNKFVINRLFDVVTVLTKRDKDILSRKGVNKAEVLYNPLFLEPLSVVPEKEKVILAVGRLNVWHVKGFDLLIKAWDSIAAKYPDWKLKIVGDGSSGSLQNLKSLINKSLDQIEFAPFTKDIVDEYKQASIFVMSSRYEGWGLAMVEAMSQGCAVIACDYHGRQAEAVSDGVSGVLCEVDNAEEIASKISLLIENDDLRTTLQQNALRAVDYYHEDKVAERLERLIEKYSR